MSYRYCEAPGYVARTDCYLYANSSTGVLSWIWTFGITTTCLLQQFFFCLTSFAVPQTANALLLQCCPYVTMWQFLVAKFLLHCAEYDIPFQHVLCTLITCFSVCPQETAEFKIGAQKLFSRVSAGDFFSDAHRCIMSYIYTRQHFGVLSEGHKAMGPKCRWHNIPA